MNVRAVGGVELAGRLRNGQTRAFVAVYRLRGLAAAAREFS